MNMISMTKQRNPTSNLRQTDGDRDQLLRDCWEIMFQSSILCVIRQRTLPEKPAEYVVLEPDVPSCTKLNRPPFPRPEGNWNRTPTSMTTKLSPDQDVSETCRHYQRNCAYDVPRLNRPQMFPRTPTTNELRGLLSA